MVLNGNKLVTTKCNQLGRLLLSEKINIYIMNIVSKRYSLIELPISRSGMDRPAGMLSVLHTDKQQLKNTKGNHRSKLKTQFQSR